MRLRSVCTLWVFLKSQEESMLEYALSQAGDNRKELEYVIKYYEGDSLKERLPAFDTQYGLSFRI